MKPKLTLRDLFWLTLVVAMALGWWMEHQASQAKLVEAEVRWRDAATETAAIRAALSVLETKRKGLVISRLEEIESQLKATD